MTLIITVLLVSAASEAWVYADTRRLDSGAETTCGRRSGRWASSCCGSFVSPLYLPRRHMMFHVELPPRREG
jgi:hypothetical protein